MCVCVCVCACVYVYEHFVQSIRVIHAHNY